jgi:uncharacterized protein (UPF0548 family)
VFFLSKPTDQEIQRILLDVSERPYNYEPVGATEECLSVAPGGFRLSRYGATLGVGDATFEAASALLASFGNYPPSFTRVVSLSSAIEVGTVFGTLATHFGFASLHPCRIIRVVQGVSPRRYGFALGTLPGHIGAGEECFLLTLDDLDGVVRYDVQAFSRPDGLLGRLGTPFFRLFQKRFERETQAAMRAHCGTNDWAIE